MRNAEAGRSLQYLTAGYTAVRTVIRSPDRTRLSPIMIREPGIIISRVQLSLSISEGRIGEKRYSSTHS